MILGIGQVIKNADTICNRQGMKEWRQKEGEKGKEKGEGDECMRGREVYGLRKGCPLTSPPL